MKICFIPPIISATVGGGINTQMHKTAEAMQSRGHEITFFNQWEKYNWHEFDIVHIFRADSTNLSIAEWLNSNNIPFVVSPIFYSSHKASRIKLAIQITELTKHFLSGMTSDLLIKKDICNLSNLVLPNTTEEASLISKSMNISKIKTEVIPNGIDASFKNATPDLFFNKFGIKDFILSTGHFGYQRKNLKRLLLAMKNIDEKLVLIGSLFEDNYSKECKILIENSDNIIFLDTLKHDDPLLASAYAAAKVFALPSLYETPGLSALEAAICGCNIVITPYGGTKEYFQEYAEYVDPLNVSSIEGCLQRSLKQAYNNNLSELIIDNFNWNIVAEKTIDAYRKVIS